MQSGIWCPRCPCCTCYWVCVWAGLWAEAGSLSPDLCSGSSLRRPRLSLLVESLHRYAGSLSLCHFDLIILELLRVKPCFLLGSVAAVGAVFRIREWASQLPHPAESGGAPPHGSEGGHGSPAGLYPLPDHLHWEEHPEERLLPVLRQGKRHSAPTVPPVRQTLACSSSGDHVVFLVFSTGMLPVVPLPPGPLSHVCYLQRAPEGEGLSTQTNISKASGEGGEVWAFQPPFPANTFDNKSCFTFEKLRFSTWRSVKFVVSFKQVVNQSRFNTEASLWPTYANETISNKTG